MVIWTPLNDRLSMGFHSSVERPFGRLSVWFLSGTLIFFVSRLCLVDQFTFHISGEFATNVNQKMAIDWCKLRLGTYFVIGSHRYGGVELLNQLNVSKRIFKTTRNQWSLQSTGVIWSHLRVCITILAAVFWTCCSFFVIPLLDHALDGHNNVIWRILTN